MLALECDPAGLPGHVEKRRNDRVLADVFGNVLFRVVRPHLLLVDVLLEDIAENIRVDLVAFARRPVIKVPVVLLEESEDPLKRLVGNFDVLAVQFFDLMLQEQAAVQVGHTPQQSIRSQRLRCFRAWQILRRRADRETPGRICLCPAACFPPAYSSGN